MAVNESKGDNARRGAVRSRSRVLHPKTERWVKRDSESGKFLDQKSDKKPCKGVRKER